jgi:IS605 OrfB family transposase
MKDHECFRTVNHPDLSFPVNTKVLKQMFIQVNREFSGWYGSIKSYNKNPEKFTSRPNIPNYSKKYFQTKLPKEAISLTKEKGKAVLSMTNITLDLPEFINKNNICEITICPDGNAFDIITSYKVDDSLIRKAVKESKNFAFKEKSKKEEANKNNNVTSEGSCINNVTSEGSCINNVTSEGSCVKTNEIIVKNNDFKNSNLKIAGCDIGLTNLMALAVNDKSSPNLIVNGCPLKSVNQYYNKKLAHKKSELPKDIYSSHAIRKLTRKRNHKINSLCHESTKKVVDFLIHHSVNCLVVGNNKGWKQDVNIGKKNNQNFVSVPFAKVRNMLKYKCHLNGIIYLETEESYTSKCSFTDRESMSHQNEYQGKRITRSLFKDGKGHIFNADIHGAFNIIRKVFGYDVFKEDVIFYIKKQILKMHNYVKLMKNKVTQEKNVNPAFG